MIGTPLRITQFFYLLCSQFRQKASGWINKTLLLIKQYITYMNISRYANMDKFVNIRHIFLLARRAYSWLFQLVQMWKLLAPGVGIVDFLTPVLVGSQRVITSAQGVIFVIGFTSINTISVLPHNYKILLQVQLPTHSDIYTLYQLQVWLKDNNILKSENLIHVYIYAKSFFLLTFWQTRQGHRASGFWSRLFSQQYHK